ncbi:MAG TPA: putative phage tail protein [Xanthobacteraceae bacterium]|nr:putative phage tail protein [Xanthobacteraceae bacterium]
MPDKWVPHSGSDYAQAYRDLLPDGPAWPRDPSSYLQKWCAGIGAIWGDVDAAAALLLTVESDPRSTVNLLPDWERNFGLPDPCMAEPSTIQARQAALVAKLTTQGGQSIAFFIATAAEMGYAITISEHSPYMCGLSQCGDTRNPAGTYRWELGPATIRYYWNVNIGLTRLSWIRCGSGQCGVDPSLTIAQATDLQCRISRWAPAHTQPIFDYAPGPQGAMAGTP